MSPIFYSKNCYGDMEHGRKSYRFPLNDGIFSFVYIMFFSFMYKCCCKRLLETFQTALVENSADIPGEIFGISIQWHFTAFKIYMKHTIQSEILQVKHLIRAVLNSWFPTGQDYISANTKDV